MFLRPDQIPLDSNTLQAVNGQLTTVGGPGGGDGVLSAANLTALAAIDTTGFVTSFAVVNDIGLYRWVSGSALTADGYSVIDSDVSGQWVQELSAASVQNVASGLGIDVQISGGTATVSAIEALRTNYAEVTQPGHGFAVRNTVRHNGTSWVKAQGNSVANCTDVWFVSAVAGNDFTVIKEGRVTSASHGLTPGALYYLSPSSAGTLVSTKPNNSIFLPVLYVESSSVVHVLGHSYPMLNTAPDGTFIQSGIATTSSAGAGLTGRLTVVFPLPFTAPPAVTATIRANSASSGIFINIADNLTTATEFYIETYTSGSVNSNPISAKFSWTAIGTRA